MLTKLKEYHYFENQLYPDLDKQIAYILSKYNDQSSKNTFLICKFGENIEFNYATTRWWFYAEKRPVLQ